MSRFMESKSGTGLLSADSPDHFANGATPAPYDLDFDDYDHVEERTFIEQLAMMSSAKTRISGHWAASSSQEAINLMQLPRRSSSCCNDKDDDWEPKDLNFLQLACSKYGPGVSWEKLPREEQVAIIRSELRSQTILISPDSGFMKCWDLLVACLLIFVAMVTPFEITFVESQNATMMWTNRFVDAIFVLDMVLQFFVKVQVVHPNGSKQLREWRPIAMRYLKGWFIIDLISVIPYDELATATVFDKSSPGASNIQNLRLLRVLRFIRFFKLVRIVKASRLVKRWQNRVSVKFTALSIARIIVMMVTSAHWMACAWGYVGIAEGSNLVCRSRIFDDSDPMFADFPDRTFYLKDVDGLDPTAAENWTGESWVTSWARSKAIGGPIDPCHPATIYAVCLYWAIQTMTSVGYGDCTPVTYLEYIIAAVCMSVSSILWAYFLGAACSIMMTMFPEYTEFGKRMDAFNLMCEDLQLPDFIRIRGRQYIREARVHARYQRNLATARYCGRSLRLAILQHVAAHYLDEVWFFKGTSVVFRAETAHCFKPYFYERRELIELPGTLCIVDKGAVLLRGQILVPFSHWGEDMLVRSHVLRIAQLPATIAFSEIQTLSRESLSAILLHHPEEARRIRRAALIIAVRRALAIVREENEGGRRRRPEFQWIHEILEKGRQIATQGGDAELANRLKATCPRLGSALPQRTHTMSNVSWLRKRLDKMDAVQERLVQSVESRVADKDELKAIKDQLSLTQQALAKLTASDVSVEDNRSSHSGPELSKFPSNGVAGVPSYPAPVRLAVPPPDCTHQFAVDEDTAVAELVAVQTRPLPAARCCPPNQGAPAE